MKSIHQRLSIYEITGEVIWFGRLNSLKVKTITGKWVQGLPKGTPDWLALIRNRQDVVSALFIECKSDSGRLRKEQSLFHDKYNKKKGVFVIEIRDPKEFDNWIDKNAKDFVACI